MFSVFLIHLASVIGFTVLWLLKVFFIITLIVISIWLLITITEFLVKLIYPNLDYDNVSKHIYFIVLVIYSIISIITIINLIKIIF